MAAADTVKVAEPPEFTGPPPVTVRPGGTPVAVTDTGMEAPATSPIGTVTVTLPPGLTLTEAGPTLKSEGVFWISITKGTGMLNPPTPIVKLKVCGTCAPFRLAGVTCGPLAVMVKVAGRIFGPTPFSVMDEGVNVTPGMVGGVTTA